MPDLTCEKCGNIVQPTDFFCRKCGSSLRSNTVIAKNPQEKRSSGLTCPDCGGSFSVKDVFCPHCGVNLDEPIEPGKPEASVLKPPVLEGSILETSVLDAPDLESLALKRGFWLTAMLILWFVMNSGLGIYYLVMALNPGQTALTSILWLLFRAAANVGFLIAIWKWKKWGAYGIVTLGWLGAFTVLLSGVSIPTLIGSILGMALVTWILYLLLRKFWNQMS